MMYAVFKARPDEIIEMETPAALASPAYCFNAEADAEKFADSLIDAEISLLESRLGHVKAKKEKLKNRKK
jgi:hypothetical protein